MKKMNKKGFTIVELVIVIAVIAILAGVMIPTFSNAVTSANKSAALQKARSAYSEYLVTANGVGVEKFKVEIDSYTIYVTNGSCSLDVPANTEGYKTATYENGKIKEIK